MAAVAEPTAMDRSDVRTIVSGGIKLGVVTVIGVVAFALLSRVLSGTVETIVQSILVLIGGMVFAYAPAYWIRPTNVDGISYASLIGVIGSTTFAVVDTALLRPIHLYRWTWDAIGGGSGFWYIPVWWMGAAFLAWLGAWVAANGAKNRGYPGAALGAAFQNGGLGVLVFAILAGLGIAPFHPAVAALGFTLALIILVPISATLNRR